MNNTLPREEPVVTLPIEEPVGLEREYNICFFKDNEQIGCLDFGSGKLVFTGNADESALILFDVLKKIVDDYIKEELDGQKSEVSE